MSVTDFMPSENTAPACHAQAGEGDEDWAAAYAELLLDSLSGHVGLALPARPLAAGATASIARHPALAIADSGLMALTGDKAAAPQLCPLPLASCVDGVALALTTVLQAAGGQWRGPLPGAATLSERAALSGLQRQGAISAGGACRLLPVADGWLAVSLPREDDWTLLAAWLECDFPCALPFTTEADDANDTAWQALAALLKPQPLARLLERAHLLGLAVAAVESVEEIWQPASPWCRIEQVVAAQVKAPPGLASMPGFAPLVIDLSSLWAGPLCGHLLQLAGARVIKVESWQRPDGARRGAAAFHDLMNHGKASVALDFSQPAETAWLRELLLRADIVIEASRPRALRQLGIQAEQIIAANPRLSWLAISGHGRAAPQAEWIAYGDDAGVAAGLSGVLLQLTGAPMFCGDAIADPLTGWHAALAGMVSHLTGGGRLISLALGDVVRHCAQFRLPANPAALQARWQEWQQLVAAARPDLHMLSSVPTPRQADGAARPLGADTAAILQEFTRSC